jgi:RNA polymerase sigma factor (TIGR02999 family)
MDLNHLVQSAERGDSGARQQLFAVLYDDLHRIAQRELRRRGGALTLTPTTVLHEAYLEISGRNAVAFPDRAHFLAYAVRVMRGLIIDYARTRRAQKRGGGFEITSLPTEVPEHIVDDRELAQIGDAVDALRTVDHDLAELVELKFFCGFSFAEIAALREISERTVQRDWDKARTLLHRSLRGTETTP